MQKNIVETIGNTPLIDISEISPNNVKIFAKLESSNPAGSIKDRVAKYLIESAEKKGNIKKWFKWLQFFYINTYEIKYRLA